MSVKADKLGPGKLVFGSTGSAKEFAAQTTKTTLKPEVTEEDGIAVLSGETWQDEGEILGSLEGEFFQEYSMTSLVAWCWENAGKVMPFEFVPATAGSMKITGECKIAPVEIGGDPRKANTTEFEFKLTTPPVIAAIEVSPGG